MTKEQNNREEESEGKGAGNKTIELAWNELKWIKLQKGKKKKKGEESHWPLCMQYEFWSVDFAGLPMNAQMGCPAQTEGALFMEKRPNPPIKHVWGSTLVDTHFLFLPLPDKYTNTQSLHKHGLLWRLHSDTMKEYTNTDTISIAHTRGSWLFTYSTVPAL